MLLTVYYTHVQYRASQLWLGQDVTHEDEQIRQCKEEVMKREEEIKQHLQRLQEIEGWLLDLLVCNFMVMSCTVIIVHLLKLRVFFCEHTFERVIC